jgi:tRNA dimethylallyltransferase
MSACASGKPLVLAILGPTATGKSALGLAVAERFNGEIINCDSTQVFRGFDIGTDKLPPSEQRGIMAAAGPRLSSAERDSIFARSPGDCFPDPDAIRHCGNGSKGSPAAAACRSCTG